MTTSLKNSGAVKQAFEAMFANRTEDQQLEDAAQLLSFRLLSEVERILEERKINRRQLAELAGTSSGYITQLFRGERTLTIDTLARFEKALNIQFTVTGRDS